MTKLRPYQKAMIAALLGATQPFVPKVPKTMKRLCIDDTPHEVCQQYDVYFNGVKQHLCHTADVEKGHILRFKRGMGNLPVKNRVGRYDTEMLTGKVEIVPKGELPSA